MKRALVLCLLLAACATPLNSFHAQQERAETLAETLYAATYNTLESLVIQGRMARADADNEERLAWRSLMTVRGAYNIGLAVDLSVLRQQAANAGVPPSIVNKAP